jgi:hypothetical protein
MLFSKQQPQPLHDAPRDFNRDEVRKEGLFWRQEGEKQ